MMDWNLDILKGSSNNIYYKGNIKISYYEREYAIWKNMIYRCCYPSSNLYGFYGAQGITIFDQWLCFEIFMYDFVNLTGYDRFRKDKMHKYDLDLNSKQGKLELKDQVYAPNITTIKPFTQCDVFNAWKNSKADDERAKLKLAEDKYNNYMAVMQSVPIDEAILKAQQPSGPDYNKYKPRGDGSYPPQAYAYVIEHPPQLNPVMNENYPPPGTVRTFNGVINLHRPPFAPNTTAGKAGFGKKVMCKIVDEKEYCINLNSEGTKK